MRFDREHLEQREAESLAPYALLSRHSRARQHPESEPRYRTAFQRDRDRVVHSAAFRRLEYKTQVFVNDEGDYYRTRLTHTLEVTQIGRTIARVLGANEDLVEAICLAHDLGHPPFGHSGEEALNELTSECGGFNHNHQSYRVVTRLERRYPEWPGLNLTYETLEGIAKHETEYDMSAIAGYDETTRGSLEAQIANVSDELAYNAHDLDDGLQAGLLATEDLNQLELWRRVCDGCGWRGGALDEVTRHLLIRELIGLQVDDALQATIIRLESLHIQTPQSVQAQSVQVVTHSESLSALNQELKSYLYDNMYSHFRVKRMATRARRFLELIFAEMLREPRQLPPEYQAEFEERDHRRVIADYIAAMTDRGALLEYRRLYDPLMKP